MAVPAERGSHNSGVQNTGSGTVNITQSAIGTHPAVRVGHSPQRTATPAASTQSGDWDIGIITVLSEETRAVTAMLTAAGSCRSRSHRSGLRFHEAHIDTAGKQINVVATQALDRGQRPAAIAFERLRQHYAPAVVLLVGIAGGISPAVTLGDVVIVQDVIYYDLRKETSARISRRGQTRPVPAAIRHAINAFFSDHGEPYQASIQDHTATPRTCNVLPGPIGSGEAVVANENSSVRAYITAFNDKTLALETEAGGLAEAFYELADTSAPSCGWLAIRGISDHADAGKDDTYHEIASWHAAAICRQMLPYLKPDDDTTN